MKKNMTMKEIPKGMQPYEKCKQFGPELLTDNELLAAVLRTGSRGENTLSMVKNLMESSGKAGLAGVFRMPPGELKKLRGIGPVKAVQLQCIGELSRRIAKEVTEPSLQMDSPETIAEHYMEQMRHLRQEQMLLLTLDTRLQIIQETIISKGTVNASMITPREVFLEALRQEAVSVVLLHNHPSGDPTPSEEDLLLTKRFSLVGDLLNVPLTDHIIIGDKEYFSLKEQGVLT